MKVKTIVHEDPDGGYWAEVPALPGCFTQAETAEELEANLLEAIEGWFAAANDTSPAEPGKVLELAV